MAGKPCAAPWSEGEDATLRRVWPRTPRPGVEAALPGRPWEGVKSRAKILRVRRGSIDSWTPDEKVILTRLWPSASQHDLLAALPGRTWEALKFKACQWKITRTVPSILPHGMGPWSDEEDAVLRRLWSWARPDALAAALPERTASAHFRRAQKLHLFRHRAYNLPPKTEPLVGEMWRQVPSRPGRIWASTEGRIAGRRGLLTPVSRPGRHTLVRFWTGAHGVDRSVASLVLETFSSSFAADKVPLFRDGDGSNNRLENLTWALRGRRAPSVRKHVRPADCTSQAGAEAASRALGQQQLWAAVTRALPRGLDPDTLSDVAGDMVVACLAGELATEDISSRAAGYLKAHRRAFNRFDHRSLDDVVGGTDDLRLGDTFSTDEYAQRWEHLQAVGERQSRA